MYVLYIHMYNHIYDYIYIYNHTQFADDQSKLQGT